MTSCKAELINRLVRRIESNLDSLSDTFARAEIAVQIYDGESSLIIASEENVVGGRVAYIVTPGDVHLLKVVSNRSGSEPFFVNRDSVRELTAVFDRFEALKLLRSPGHGYTAGVGEDDAIASDRDALSITPEN
jgi:hypothetical protein